MNSRIIQNTVIRGISLDAQTRCSHYDGETDIIAIRFKCCDAFYACYHCHEEIADHESSVWSRAEFDYPAIICGNCGEQFPINRYLADHQACPNCNTQFNPGCLNHHHLYFEVPMDSKP